MEGRRVTTNGVPRARGRGGSEANTTSAHLVTAKVTALKLRNTLRLWKEAQGPVPYIQCLGFYCFPELNSSNSCYGQVSIWGNPTISWKAWSTEFWVKPKPCYFYRIFCLVYLPALLLYIKHSKRKLFASSMVWALAMNWKRCFHFLAGWDWEILVWVKCPFTTQHMESLTWED